jgi:hypothetical protein
MSKIKVPTDSVLGEATLLGLSTTILLSLHMVEGESSSLFFSPF